MTLPAMLLVALVGVGGDSLRIAVAPGESLRVVVSGAGAPVVLIPGLAGTAFGYRHLVGELAETGWLTIVIEPLGVGGSSRPARADYSLAAQADRIAAVLDTLRVMSAMVVAHAIAGSVALRLAYRHPRLVRALVSIEGGAAESTARPGVRRLIGLAPLLRHLGGSEVLQALMVHEMRRASADTAWIDQAVIRGYTAEAVRDVGATASAYRGMARAQEPERLADRLHEIRAPVALLLGGAPHRGGPAEAEITLLRQRLAGLEVHEVAGAGHYIHEEQPAAVLAVIRRLALVAGPPQGPLAKP